MAEEAAVDGGDLRARVPGWRKFLDLPGLKVHYCPTCAHYTGWRRCAAFPTIPEPIWDGRVFHDEPYPGDQGFRYKPRRP